MTEKIHRTMAGIALVLTSAALARCGSSGTASATIITIPSGATGRGSLAYGTNPLHVAVGAKVAWVNSDSVTHTATSTGNWDTGNISAGATSSVVTISAAGTYNYFCSIHGVGSMSGQIISP